MEPVHVQALIRLEVDQAVRLEQLERYFAVRAEARQKRRRRAQRLRQRLSTRTAHRPGTQPRPQPAL